MYCHQGKIGIIKFVIRDCQNYQIVIGNLLKYGHIGKVESVEFRDCRVLSKKGVPKKVECVNSLVIFEAEREISNCVRLSFKGDYLSRAANIKGIAVFI